MTFEPGQATFLADRAAELLTAGRAALVTDRTPNGPAGWSARTHGPPVLDPEVKDDVLAVYSCKPAILLGAVAQAPAAQRGRLQVMPIAQFYVELWRHVIGRDGHGRIPPAERIDAEAAALQVDGMALASELLERNRLGTLFSTPTTPIAVARIGDPEPLPTSGKMAGWRIQVDVPVIGPSTIPTA